MVKRHPRYDYKVTAHNERGCRITFLQDGETIGVSEFTSEDAARAGLNGTNWSKYPKAMYFARALTQGVRWYCPDVTAGAPAYSPEEVGGPGVEEGTEVAPLIDDDPMLELAAQIEDFEFDSEQRATIRDFVKTGGPEAVDTALRLLKNGNPSALFAGIQYETEAVA